jgi:hypothetical protein
MGQGSMRPRDGEERICVIIVIVDDDNQIFIAAAVVLCDLIAIVRGDRYVAYVDIGLRCRNFYVLVLISR